MAQILNTLQREINDKYKTFDPNNKEHIQAYYMLRYQGKQHPTLRFSLVEPHKDVINMMMTKIAENVLIKNFGFIPATLMLEKQK